MIQSINRLVLSAVIGAALLGSLSGCFLLPAGPAIQQSSERDDDDSEDDKNEKPASTDFATVGDCWQVRAVELAEWSVWEGDEPVNCNKDHQSYTFFAGELKAEVENAWQGGDITDELVAAVAAQCAINLRKLGVPLAAARVGSYFFVAPEDEWEDGNHSIRCDVAVTALDSDWYDPDLEDLPNDIDELIDDIEENEVSYEFCLIGDAFGPYESSEAYLADCGGVYYWRFEEAVYFDALPDDPYPSDADLYAFGEASCPASHARDGEEPLYYVPSREMWASDLRYVDCWYSTIEQPRSPV